MMLRSLTLLTASSSCLAGAFLLPPSIESAVDGLDQLTAAGGLIDPRNQLVKLECKGCPFAKDDAQSEGGVRWVEDVPNSLMIKIAVDSEHPDQLTVNDVQIYPSLPLYPPQPIYAKQVESDVSPVDFKAADNEDESPYKSLRLGFMSVVEKTADLAHISDEAEIVRVEFQVSSLEDKSVDGLDKIKATVLKTPDGKLLIARVELEPTAPEKDVEDGARCMAPPLICKIKALMSGGLHKVKIALHRCKHKMRLPLFGVHRHHGMHHGGKPCRHHAHHGMPGFPALAPVPVPPVAVDVAPVATDASVPPAAFHGHVEHHPYRPYYPRKHHFLHIVARMAMHIVVPILIGVAAGMTASLLGMMVGQLVVMVWRRFYRSRNAGRYASVAQEEDGSSDDGESDAATEEKPFLDEEDLPAYDATEEINIVEKKE